MESLLPREFRPKASGGGNAVPARLGQRQDQKRTETDLKRMAWCDLPPLHGETSDSARVSTSSRCLTFHRGRTPWGDPELLRALSQAGGGGEGGERGEGGEERAIRGSGPAVPIRGSVGGPSCRVAAAPTRLSE